MGNLRSPLMVSASTVVEFAHVVFGMMWVGVSIYVEAVLAPLLKETRTVGAFRGFLPLFGRTSLFQTVSGFFVLLTGIVYMLLHYWPLETLVAPIPGVAVVPGVLVLLSLGLVLVALGVGTAFLKPTAMRVAKFPFPADPGAPIPEPVQGLVRTLLRGASLNMAIVVVVLLLMVIAATGGV